METPRHPLPHDTFFYSIYEAEHHSSYTLCTQITMHYLHIVYTFIQLNKPNYMLYRLPMSSICVYLLQAYDTTRCMHHVLCLHSIQQHQQKESNKKYSQTIGKHLANIVHAFRLQINRLMLFLEFDAVYFDLSQCYVFFSVPIWWWLWLLFFLAHNTKVTYGFITYHTNTHIPR